MHGGEDTERSEWYTYGTETEHYNSKLNINLMKDVHRIKSDFCDKATLHLQNP
jgi:hypothetical protein